MFCPILCIASVVYGSNLRNFYMDPRPRGSTWSNTKRRRHDGGSRRRSTARCSEGLEIVRRSEEQHVKLTEGSDGRLWECCNCFSRHPPAHLLPLAVILPNSCNPIGTSFLGRRPARESGLAVGLEDSTSEEAGINGLV
jgi:hypothetical protein